MKKLYFVLFLSFFYCEAENLNHKEALEKSKKNLVYFINYDEKKNKIKNLTSIFASRLEYKYPNLKQIQEKKDIPIIIYSKEKIVHKSLEKKLRELKYNNIYYLKDGIKSWREILINFRGIKFFSIFKL